MFGKQNNGLMMMLKGFGINPEEIQASFENLQQQATKVVQHFEARLTRIENNQALILAALERIESAQDAVVLAGKALALAEPLPENPAATEQENDTWPMVPTKL